MTIDRPAIRLDFRGTVDAHPEMTAALKVLAETWPLGAQVRHRSFGTNGVIRLDSPANVPGQFDGRPGAWCVGGDGYAWVSVVWGADTTVPLRAWAPARSLRLTGRSA